MATDYTTSSDSTKNNKFKKGSPVNGIETVTKDGDTIKAPDLVVPNATSARVIYERMRNSHSKRALVFARIKGMIDGNPPYSKKGMTRQGLQTNSNVNWRDGESIFESVALTYWSLFNDVRYIAEFSTDLGDPNQNPQTGLTVSEVFDETVRSWPEFYDVMAQHQSDLIQFGSSFLVWTHKKDWRYDVADIWRVLTPEKTRNNTEKISICAIEHVMTAQELWEIYENSKSDKWDHDAVGAILLHNAKFKEKDKAYSSSAVLNLQTRIRNNDLNMDEIYQDDIVMISMYVREFNGKISRGIFSPNGTTGDPDDWAFFDKDQYEQMGQALAHFSFTPGEKYLHGSKGTGHRIYNTIEGTTQIDNSLMDQARRSATVLIRTRQGKSKSLAQHTFSHGGFTDIGESEYIQNLMGSNSGAGVEIAQYFRAKLERNNNMSGAFMGGPDSKVRGPADVREQVTREAKVQKNRISHYYQQLDSVFREMVRKMLLSKSGDPGYEYVEMWKKKCIARGVPEEFFKLTKENAGPNGLPEHMKVSATRASGSGSQYADQVEMQSVMSILPTLGERGRTAALQDFVAANRGHRYVARYLPPEDQTQEPTSEDTIASIENNQLEKGEMVVVSPDNNHAIHAERHIQRLQQIAQLFNESESAAREAGSDTPSVDANQFGQYGLNEVDIAFQTLGPHFVRHLLYLQQDPTRASEAQSLGRRWAILANFGDKIANNAQEHRAKVVREQQKALEQMEQLDMEERVKMKEVEMNARVKLFKARGEMANASNRTQLEFLIGQQKVSFENELKKASTISKIANDAAKTLSEELTGKRDSEVF